MLGTRIQLPSIPGLPGLPIFYVPALVWGGVTLLFERLRVAKAVEEQIGRIVAAGLGVVCVALVWSSLASPTHRSCAENEGEDCVRYEIEAGPDMQSAFMWGIGAWLLFTLASNRVPPTAVSR